MLIKVGRYGSPNREPEPIGVAIVYQQKIMDLLDGGRDSLQRALIGSMRWLAYLAKALWPNRARFPVRKRPSRATAAKSEGLVTVEELGAYLSVPPSALHRLIESRQLPSIKVGRHWRMELERVQDWLIDSFERRRRY